MVQLMTGGKAESSVEAPLMANRRRVRDTDAHRADTRPQRRRKISLAKLVLGRRRRPAADIRRTNAMSRGIARRDVRDPR